MPTFEYNQETMPTAAELRRVLQEAEENYDPVEELLSLERQLAQLEQEHEIASSEFYHRYQAGKMGDEVAFVAWAGRYRLYLRLKEVISSSLKLVLTESSAPLTP